MRMMIHPTTRRTLPVRVGWRVALSLLLSIILLKYQSAQCTPSPPTFPTLEEVLEMATLSSLIYAFHKEDYGNDDVGNDVCDRINRRNISKPTSIRRTTNASTNVHLLHDYNRTIPQGIHCEWYHHDWIDGTQVMIVSSVIQNYVAIVFAGTDDMTTSLLDANVLLTPFGFPAASVINDTLYPVYNVTLDDPNVRVHAGFDSSIFNERNLFGALVVRVERLRQQLLAPRFFTTGHSLGASHSILTAVAFLQYYEQVRKGTVRPPVARPARPADAIVAINFGSPQMGNTAWRDAIHSGVLQERLRIYRFVLGWDLVPRLPAVLQHVGHTMQLTASPSSTVPTAAAYYHHLGDASLQYAGVPLGWSATPFLWIPGALWAHFITAYVQFLSDLPTAAWVVDFERRSDPSPPGPVYYDDDYYVEPPVVDVQ
jgi:Lipase (class 3)